MASIKVVCDASYDEELRLTGFAGGLYVTDQNNITSTQMYQGVEGEQKDINEGELTAIICGLRELRTLQMIRQLSVSRIDVHSDSMASIDALKRYLSNPNDVISEQYAPLYQAIDEIIKLQKWTISFSHVTSHVPDKRANLIEKLNAIADQKASEARRQCLAQMLSPSIDNSKHVAVLCPSVPRNKEEASEWYRLATGILESGQRIRLYLEGPRGHETNPFLEADKDFSNRTGILNKKLVKRIYQDSSALNKGLNMTMMRYHVVQSGRDPFFELNGKPIQQRAAIASELLYGDTCPEGTDMRRMSGRLYPPSKAVLDLLAPLPKNPKKRPHSVQGWTATYLDYVDIPYICGLKNALNFADIKPMHSIKPRRHNSMKRSVNTEFVTDDDLKGALRTIYKDYKECLDINQVAHKMIDTLQNHGYPKNKGFEESMERFILTTSKFDEDRFLNRVTRHASRITPPPSNNQNTTANTDNVTDTNHVRCKPR